MLHALFQLRLNAINPAKNAPFCSKQRKTAVESAVAPIANHDALARCKRNGQGPVEGISHADGKRHTFSNWAFQIDGCEELVPSPRDSQVGTARPEAGLLQRGQRPVQDM